MVRHWFERMIDYCHTTRLSLLHSMISDSKTEKHSAFERFFHEYGPGLRALVASYFRRNSAEARRIVDDFIGDKVFEKDLVAKFLIAKKRGESKFASRGFRRYLAASLYNYVRSHRPRHEVVDQRRVSEAAFIQQFDEWFSIGFYRELVATILRRTRVHYEAEGRTEHWKIYARVYIEPILTRRKRPSFRKLGEQFGITSKQAANRLENVKAYVRKMMCEELTRAFGTSDISAAAAELDDLRSLLAGAIASPAALGIEESISATAGGAIGIDLLDTPRLSELSDVVMNQFGDYSSQELAACFRYVLTIPLASVYEAEGLEIHPAVRSYSESLESPCTLEHLITWPPDWEVLVELKRLFSGLVTQKHAFLPAPVALTLRYTTIALAIIHYPSGVISRKSEQDLAAAFQYVLNNKWLDKNCRLVLERARQATAG